MKIEDNEIVVIISDKPHTPASFMGKMGFDPGRCLTITRSSDLDKLQGLADCRRKVSAFYLWTRPNPFNVPMQRAIQELSALGIIATIVTDW